MCLQYRLRPNSPCLGSRSMLSPQFSPPHNASHSPPLSSSHQPTSSSTPSLPFHSPHSLSLPSPTLSLSADSKSSTINSTTRECACFLAFLLTTATHKTPPF
ncbi:hypothetical protein Mapa_008354 [Marchantia paleacea]|nr:hypothetical protein Mapa_008354 [Marchantia paleacea]